MNSGSGLQFDKVEYQAQAGASNCVFCNKPISSPYYRVNGEQACAACVEKEQAARRDGATHYSRALLFGIGAAIVGLIGYAAFEITTNFTIGYLSVGVGWLIAKAMLKGSNGFAGRKYQITAVLLTYFAVSLAAIPVLISQVRGQKSPPQVQTQAPASAVPVVPDPASASSPTQQAPESAQPSATNQGQPATAAVSTNGQSAPPKPSLAALGKALGMLFLIGIASPFLELADPVHGFIGLIILFVGMQIAWKMTGRPKLAIDGPF